MYGQCRSQATKGAREACCGANPARGWAWGVRCDSTFTRRTALRPAERDMAAVALQACGNALLEGASDASKALGRARELLAQESPEDEPYRGVYAAVDEIMRTRDALEADGAQEARSKVRRGAHLKKNEVCA